MVSITELLMILILGSVVLWLIALMDILKGDFKGNDKIVWIIVVIFLPVIGPILYFLVGKKQKISGMKAG